MKGKIKLEKDVSVIKKFVALIDSLIKLKIGDRFSVTYDGDINLVFRDKNNDEGCVIAFFDNCDSECFEFCDEVANYHGSLIYPAVVDFHDMVIIFFRKS